MIFFWRKNHYIFFSQLRADQMPKLVRFLDLCVSSLRRDHANLLCIVSNLDSMSEVFAPRYLAGLVSTHG